MDAQGSAKPDHEFHRADVTDSMSAFGNQLVFFPDIEWQLRVWRLYIS